MDAENVGVEPRQKLFWVPRPLSALSSPKEAVRQFTPSWFTLVMSTGIVGTLIGQFPYDVPAKLEAGWAFWWLALVLFCAFSLMLICRFVFFWSDALQLIAHPVQALFLGAIPPSLAVIVNGMPLFLAHWWDHSAVMDAAVVLWWVMVALALACTLLLPWYMLTRHRYSLDSMTAVLLMPLLPCVVAAGSGGIVARAADVEPARSIVYMSYILWGIGVLLCFHVLTIYYRRLLNHSMPPNELIVSSFMPVGPMGMSALALLNLGAALTRIFPPPTPQEWAALTTAADPSDPATLRLLFESSLGSVANVGGTLVALVLWGNGVWWLVVAISSVGSVLWTSSLPFNIGWWGFVFPLGVFSAAANELWQRLPEMEAMRVTAAVLICCVVLLWALVFFYTLVLGWNGSLFYAPCLANIPGKPDSSKGQPPALDPSDPAAEKAQPVNEQQWEQDAGRAGGSVSSTIYSQGQPPAAEAAERWRDGPAAASGAEAESAMPSV